MKASAYLRTYGDKIDSGRNKKKFLADIENDFSILLVTHHAEGSLKQFERAVLDLKKKWDGIGNKRGKELDPKLWVKVEKTIINTARIEMHGPIEDAE